MNKPTNSLTFDLIKSLEPTEKAYIKKQFSANEKNLKQLFDDLNKTEIYNSDQFKVKHKSKKHINHLPQNQTYLRKKIIDALIQYNAKSIPQINKRHELNTINILIHKGLLNQAVKLIQQGLQKNEPLEHYMYCYELCLLIVNLVFNNVEYTLTIETADYFVKKRSFYIKQLSIREKFAEFVTIHQAQINDEQKVKVLIEKFTELELEHANEPPENYPFFAKRMFYYSKSKISELQNKSLLAINFLENCLNLYFKFPQFLHKNYVPFLTDSSNYLDRLNSNAQYVLFFKWHKKILNKIEEITKGNVKNDFITTHYVIKYYLYELACNKSKQYQKAFIFSKDYLQFLGGQKNLSDQFIAASRIAIAVANLNVQHFKETIDIINPILNTKFYQYQYELRLIQLIAHYRLGNDLVLDSLFTSFIYYLKKQEKPEQTKTIRTLKKCMEKQNFNALENVEFDELLSLNVPFALTTTLLAD